MADIPRIDAAALAAAAWDIFWEPWAPATVADWRGHLTIERLATLRAHGRRAV